MSSAPDFWNWRSGVFQFLSQEPLSSDVLSNSGQQALPELTIEQIQKTYSGQWVSIKITSQQNDLPKTGQVIFHSRDFLRITEQVALSNDGLYTFYCSTNSIHRFTLPTNSSKQEQKAFRQGIRILQRINPGWHLFHDWNRPGELEAVVMIQKGKDSTQHRAAYLVTTALSRVFKSSYGN